MFTMMTYEFALLPARNGKYITNDLRICYQPSANLCSRMVALCSLFLGVNLVGNCKAGRMYCRSTELFLLMRNS